MRTYFYGIVKTSGGKIMQVVDDIDCINNECEYLNNFQSETDQQAREFARLKVDYFNNIKGLELNTARFYEFEQF